VDLKLCLVLNSFTSVVVMLFSYIPENEVLEDSFQQLVGGVIWLVRNGEVYVDDSKIAECPETQLTGKL
jgi:N-acetylglucosamine-1-phosphodiester alpha-N-acetylglucosaminidase